MHRRRLKKYPSKLAGQSHLAPLAWLLLFIARVSPMLAEKSQTQDTGD